MSQAIPNFIWKLLTPKTDLPANLDLFSIQNN